MHPSLVYQKDDLMWNMKNVVRYTEITEQPILLDLNRKKYVFGPHCEFGALRPPLVEMLDKVADALPGGERLLILDAYRSPERQMKVWENVLTHLRGQHPHWCDQELKAQACRWAGDPEGLNCPHRMGAAVDLTICDEEGQPLDLGVSYVPDAPCYPQLTPEQQKNQRKLLSLMVAVGFVADAENIRHFSYGDEAWARAKGKRQTMYKPIKHLIIKSRCSGKN